MADLDSTENQHPLTDLPKIVTGDYVGDTYTCTTFGANPSTGSFCANHLIVKILPVNDP